MKKYLIIGILAVIIPLIVAVIIIIVQKECELYLNANDTILLFVGILATFVVISNQVQIRSIETRIDKLEGKISKTNDEVIDVKLNSSDNVKYMRFAVGLIIKDGGDQWSKITAALAKYENIEKRLKDFAKGKNEGREFLFALADAFNLSKDDYPNVEN